MGTKFKTMLAPIGLPTGDGRRFARDAITTVPTPFPLEWVRERESGHSGAVSVGSVQETAALSVAEALRDGWISPERVVGMDPGAMGVWGRGEFFDDADREKMPRLAEDVATAMHLIENGTLGPSVDLDSFEGVPVMAGSDEPMTESAFEAHFELTGQEPKLELLVTSGRVRAGTLVSIPAFAETSRPLELIINEQAGDPMALLASIGVQALPSMAAFDGAPLTGPTPITYDHETGRVFGHIATWQTCHVGYSDVCVTAPRAQDAYAAFNRFPVETADGVVWAGRITAGGRHAGLSLSASGAISEYDSKVVAAHVRAYEDEFGIAVAGVLAADLDEGTKAVLSRRKVSGDWRETQHGLSLVEVLALSPGPRAHAEPGFPVETFSRAGRQVALVASLSPDPEPFPGGSGSEMGSDGNPGGNGFDLEALAASVVDEMSRRRAREEAAVELEKLIKSDARSSLAAALKGA